MNRPAIAEHVRQTMETARGLIRVRAVFLALMGVAFLVAKLADPSILHVSGIGATGNWIVMLLVIALMIAGAVWSWREWQQSEASKRPAVVALRDDPLRIVWIYTVKIMRYNAHHYTDVYFCFDDGTHDLTRVPRRDESEFLALVTEPCPHATQGFSNDLAARYCQRPASLRRAV